MDIQINDFGLFLIAFTEAVKGDDTRVWSIAMWQLVILEAVNKADKMGRENAKANMGLANRSEQCGVMEEHSTFAEPNADDRHEYRDSTQ